MAATVGHVSLWQRGTDLITTSLPKLSKGPFPSGRLPHGIYHFFMVYTSTIVVHDDIHVVYNDIYHMAFKRTSPPTQAALASLKT
jgi:hypothetical protein